MGIAWGDMIHDVHLEFLSSFASLLFDRVAQGSGFRALIFLGTSILGPFSLGVLLRVDLLGAVRQGCSENDFFEVEMEMVPK